MSSRPNIGTKAERRSIAQVEHEFRGPPQFCVATVDFGTTHCSVYYALHPGTGEEQLIPLQLDRVNDRPRVPNCILFGKEHGKLLAFGYRAREKYRDLRDEQRPRFFYFEHMKKEFQRQENINRNTRVEASNGESFFLLDVIAQMLFFLKSMLLSSLRPFERSDIDWVITVPAIWRAAGKQMMREAAYKAGLCKDGNDIIDPLKPAGTQNEAQFSPTDSDRLSLALEPESAAIQCQKAIIREPQCYIVADIGGGTVDIACHRMVDGHVEEVHRPVGNEWGGTKVNEEFKNFLEKLVRNPGFSAYVGPRVPNHMKHKADLNELLYERFETAKINFGSEDDETSDYVIRFPSSFWNVYGKVIFSKIKKIRGGGKVQIDGENKLRCSYSQMTEFFHPSITKIYDELKVLLSQRCCRDVDTIYWVGGYGDCKYLRRQLETRIKRNFGDVYNFISPPQPQLAVVRGATTFRCNPQTVRQRKADATYGTRIRSLFIEGFHYPHYKVRSEDRNRFECENVFSTFVEVGESICTGEIFVHSCKPMCKDQKEACIQIYSSPNTDVTYTTDREVRKIGEVVIQLEGEGLDRDIEVLFDFTHAEIQVRAYQKPSGKEYKTVVDFLTQL